MMSKKIIAGEIDKSKPVLIDVFDGVVVMRNEAKEVKEKVKK
jgi:ATP-dependent Clp protease ATP-binding subunit ClpB